MAESNNIDANAQTQEKKSNSLAGKPRTVLAWMKPCIKDDTLNTLMNLSSEELKELQEIIDKVQKKKDEAVKTIAAREIEKEEEALKKLEEELAKRKSKLANLKAQREKELQN